MIFSAYLIFLLYWSVEGYSDAKVKEKFKNNRKVLKFIFTSLSFILIYQMYSSFWFTTLVIASFLLAVPNLYKGFKSIALNKSWFSKCKNRNIRLSMFILSNISVVYLTILANSID